MWNKTNKCNCGNDKDCRAKRCLVCSKRLLRGATHPMFGRKHSVKSKELMSIKHKGKELSELHKVNLSISLIGKNSGQHNGMFGKVGKLNPMFDIHRFGKESPGYINGRTSLYRAIRSMEYYSKWIIEVFKKDNFTCQDCGDNRGGNLEAHHLKSFAQIMQEFINEYSQFSPIEDIETLLRLSLSYKSFWEINNGITLCKNCHKLTPNYGKKGYRKCL